MGYFFFWGEGEGGVRGLFLVILLCEIKKLEFFRGGGGS